MQLSAAFQGVRVNTQRPGRKRQMAPQLNGLAGRKTIFPFVEQSDFIAKTLRQNPINVIFRASPHHIDITLDFKCQEQSFLL